MNTNPQVTPHNEWWDWPERIPGPPKEYDPYAELYLGRGQLHSIPRPFPLIEGVLNEGTYAILRGRDQSFKSFIAMDWACSLATGTPWLGRETQPDVRVLYMAGEGVADVENRILAWEDAHGVAVDNEALTIRRGAIDFYRDDNPAFADFVKRVSLGHYGLVILDTLSRISGVADQNSSGMNAVLRRIDQVRDCMDYGTVLTVNHTDKSDSDSRGFSGIEDDADTVWHAKRPKHRLEVRLTLEKMKSGSDGYSINLAGEVVGRSLAFRESFTPDPPPSETGDELLDKSAEVKQQITTALADASGDLTWNALFRLVKGNKKAFTQALTELKSSRHITVTQKGQSQMHHLERLFTDGGGDDA